MEKNAATKGARKRSGSARKLRGAPVVRRTLDATIDELGRVGYAAFRIEDVARRAKVNKTTIYRRWPTKEDLVRAALLALAERTGSLTVPDTGSLEGDLSALVLQKARFACSPEGSALIRIMQAGDPDLLAIARSLRGARDVVLRTILERSKARGSLRDEVDIGLFMEVVQQACDYTLSKAGRVEPRFVKRLVDLLLHGAGKRTTGNSKLRSKKN